VIFTKEKLWGHPLRARGAELPLAALAAAFVLVFQQIRDGVAGRNRPARGVAQDVPFFTAARLERRAGALTETVGGYEGILGLRIWLSVLTEIGLFT
jgi:hypothetical protein